MSFNQFFREAVRAHVARLKQQALAKQTEEGYRAEARSPSLDEEWTDIETGSWPVRPMSGRSSPAG